MRKVFAALLLFGACLILLSSTNSLVIADSGESFTVAAVVLPVRIIYINSSGIIVRVASNSNNVAPVVRMLPANTEHVLTNNIFSQYAYIIGHCLGANKAVFDYNGYCPNNKEKKFSTSRRLVADMSVIQMHHIF